MSLARGAFMERMAGAGAASQDVLLLGQPGTSLAAGEAARLLRNGLAVTCFAALEGFVKSRTGEVATWLSSAGIAFSQYPQALRDAARNRAVNVLASLLRRDPDGKEMTDTLVDLGNSWSKMQTGGAWQLPHAALLWPQSNLRAGEAVAILAGLGVCNDWAQITKVATDAGFPVAPTQNLFNAIVDRRHGSAHDADYDADILTLRATPSNMIAFAYAFDAFLSSAARLISRVQIPLPIGAKAVRLIRLDQSPSSPGEWSRFDGAAANSSLQATETHVGAKHEVVVALRARLTGPSDVLVVRTWDGLQHNVDEWHTPGV